MKSLSAVNLVHRVRGPGLQHEKNMIIKTFISIGAAAFLVSGAVSFAEINTVVEHKPNEGASAAFKFDKVPALAKTNAANQARFVLVDGVRDENGADLNVLHDGKLPSEEDEPSANFFFAEGTDGGRVLVDLGKAIDIKQVNTYSWHPSTRAPQVYKLYGSDGKVEAFAAQPKKETDPEKVGWKLVTGVDTRPTSGEGGGQYGVGISDSAGAIGHYRYLLFDISRTQKDDDFGNTFYSEIAVVGGEGSEASETAESSDSGGVFVAHSPDGKCEFTIDTSGAPNLTDWATNKLAPVLAEWYPKIAAMLPSEGYTPPAKFSITIRPGRGVAATGGTRVTANSTWLEGELQGQAIGSLLHEEVHVIQQYGRARRTNPDATRSPGWLVEGIPDYIRWFLYEPQSHGADIEWMRHRRNFTPSYDGSYRITANFLDWVVNKYDKDIVRVLNAAMREGKYTDEIWKKRTGKSVEELGDEWKTSVQKQLAADGKS
jgi:hypothetical protein